MAAFTLASLLLLKISYCLAAIGYTPEAVYYDAASLIDRIHKNSQLPEGIDPAFDCDARLLAYNVSRSLQSSRGNLLSVWDALQLSTVCKQKPPQDDRPEKENEGAFQQAPNDLPTFFVDGTNGNDDNPGTLALPFQTIDRAVLATRAIGTDIQRVIYLRAGVYYLTDTLRLGPDDSFLTISAFYKESVVISGGTLLDVQ